MSPRRAGWNARRRRARRNVLERYGQVCQLCGQPIDPDLPEDHPRGLTMDHIVPRAAGGVHGPSNWQPAHRDCNEHKGGE